MNKNFLLGIVAFGGLLLIAALLPNNATEEEPIVDPVPEEQAVSSEVQTLFPTYPNTTAANYRESTSDDGRQFYSFRLTGEATIQAVNDWYRDALSSDGWSIKSDKNVAGYQIIQGEKDNLYTSMQAVNGNAPGTVTISQQAQIRPVDNE